MTTIASGMTPPVAGVSGGRRPAGHAAATAYRDSLWLPASPCGSGCLPEPGSLPSVGTARAATRLAGAAAVLLVGFAGACLPSGHRGQQRLFRFVAGALLRALGIRHEVSGRIAPYGALLATSHVSWVDVLVLLAHRPVRLVAKREVRRWPLAGPLAARAGTIFVDRARPSQLPATVAEVAAALRQGDTVAVFPEGTTWCGQERGRFRTALFQAAVDTRAPVQPVSLSFRVNGGPSTVAAFVGDDTLVRSLRRVLRVRGLEVSARLHPPVYPGTGGGRQRLATAAADRISRAAGHA